MKILFYFLCSLIIFLSFNFTIYSQLTNQWEIVDTTEDYNVGYFKPDKRLSGIDENDFVVITGTELQKINKNNHYVIKKYINRAKISELIYYDSVKTSQRLHSIAHPSKNLIVVVGDTSEFLEHIFVLDYFKSFSMFLISTDGGKSWQRKIIDSNKVFRNISMCDSLNGIIYQMQVDNIYNKFEGPRRDSLLVTNDGWKTYKTIPLPVDVGYITYASYALCLSPTKYYWYICSDIDTLYHLYNTENGGNSWMKIFTFEENLSISDIKILDSQYMFASANRNIKKYTGYLEPVILKSEDGGYTWRECKNVFHEIREDISRLWSIDFFDSFNGKAGGTNYALRTNDGGETWSKEYAPFQAPGVESPTFYDNMRQVFTPKKDFTISVNYIKYILKCENEKILSKPKFYKIYNHLFQPLNNVIVSWSSVEGAKRYRLKIDTIYHGGSSGDIEFNNPYKDTILTDTTILMNNLLVNYFYASWVKAIGDSIESDWSASHDGWGDFRTMANDSELYSPEIIYPPYASRVNTKKVTLLWNKVPTADSYSLIIENDKNSDLINEIVNDTSFNINNLIPSAFYYITLKSVRQGKSPSLYFWHYFATRAILSTEDKHGSEIKQNIFTYPIPFSTSFNIEFTNKTSSIVNIDLYNILGNKIYSKNLGLLESGKHSITIEPNVELSPGCYVVAVRNGGNVQYMKIIKGE